MGVVLFMFELQLTTLFSQKIRLKLLQIIFHIEVAENGMTCTFLQKLASENWLNMGFDAKLIILFISLALCDIFAVQFVKKNNF